MRHLGRKGEVIARVQHLYTAGRAGLQTPPDNDQMLHCSLGMRPWWQTALGLHLSTDENWALLHAKRAQGRDFGCWYLTGAGLMLAAG